MKSNKVALAASGVDLDSPSFGAFLEASKKTVKQDISRLQVNGLADVVNSSKSAQQTSMAAQASASGYQARQTAARYGMYRNIASMGGDLVRAAQGAVMILYLDNNMAVRKERLTTNLVNTLGVVEPKGAKEAARQAGLTADAWAEATEKLVKVLKICS